MALVSKSVEFFSGFDPRMIPGCMLWLDGTDSTSITGTTQVTQWRDKSSNAYLFTRKSSGFPVVSNISYSGLNGVFIGSNAALENSNIPIPAAYSIYAVANRLSSNGGFGYIVKMNNITDFYGFLGVANVANGFATFVGTNTLWRDVTSNTPKKIITDIPVLVGYDVCGSGLFPYWNGHRMTSKVGNPTATTGMTIGDAATNTFGQPWLGIIGEVLMFSNVLSDAQRQQLEGYLMFKWKLQRYETPVNGWVTGATPEIFNPLSVSGIALWLDASDTSTLTLSGSNVTGWSDKSGLGRVITFRGAVGASNPTYDPLARAVVTNSNSFTAANVDTRKSTTPYFNVFIVYRWLGGDSNGQTSNACLWGADQGGGFNRFQLLGANSLVDIAYGLSRSGNTSPNIIPVTGLETTNQVVYSCRYDLSTTQLPMFARVNGIKTSLSNYTEGGVSTQTSMTSTAFGAIDELNSFPTRIAFNEILVYRADMSESTRISIESYLGAKWKIPWYTQVTPTHPFAHEPALHRPIVPTDISSCALWLDAADYATISLSGTGVALWRDKSGFLNDASQTISTAYYPTYSNGLLRFNGVSSFLQIRSPAIRPTNAFVVVQSASATGHVYRKGRGAPTDFETLLRYDTSNIQTLYANSGGTTGSATFTSGATPNRIAIAATWDLSAIRLYTDGVLRATTPLAGPQFIATTQCTDMRIGAEFGAASNTSAPFAGTLWNGTMGEIVMFSNALSIAQREIMDGYMSWKWNTTLPAGHTFSNRYPLATQFTPGQIPNLALWLDATDSTTFDLSGANILRWRDKSGAGLYSFSARTYDASAIGVCRLSNNIFGSFPAVRFTGSNCFVGNTSVTGTGVATYAIVSTDVSFQALDQRIVSLAAPGLNDHAGVARVVALYFPGNLSNSLATYRNGFIISRAAVRANTPIVADSLYTGAQGFVYADGSLGTLQGPSNSTGNFACTLYGIGNQAATLTNEFLVGYVGEVLMFSNALSAWERQRVEGYLATKWNLTGQMPTWHPYKTVSP